MQAELDAVGDIVDPEEAAQEAVLDLLGQRLPLRQVEGDAHLVDEIVDLGVGESAEVLVAVGVNAGAEELGGVGGARGGAPAEPGGEFAVGEALSNLAVVLEANVDAETGVALQHGLEALADAGEDAFEDVGDDEVDLVEEVRSAGSVEEGGDLGQVFVLVGVVAGSFEQVRLRQGPALEEPREGSGGAAVAEVDAVDHVEAVDAETQGHADTGIAERIVGVGGDAQLELDGSVERDFEGGVVGELFAQSFDAAFGEGKVDAVEQTIAVALADRLGGNAADDDAVGIGAGGPPVLGALEGDIAIADEADGLEWARAGGELVDIGLVAPAVAELLGALGADHPAPGTGDEVGEERRLRLRGGDGESRVVGGVNGGEGAEASAAIEEKVGIVGGVEGVLLSGDVEARIVRGEEATGSQVVVPEAGCRSDAEDVGGFVGRLGELGEVRLEGAGGDGGRPHKAVVAEAEIALRLLEARAVRVPTVVLFRDAEEVDDARR